MTPVELFICFIVLCIHVAMTCLTFSHCLGKTGGSFTIDARWKRRLYVFMMLFVPIGPLLFIVGGATIEYVYEVAEKYIKMIKEAIE